MLRATLCCNSLLQSATLISGVRPLSRFYRDQTVLNRISFTVNLAVTVQDRCRSLKSWSSSRCITCRRCYRNGDLDRLSQLAFFYIGLSFTCCVWTTGQKYGRSNLFTFL